MVQGYKFNIFYPDLVDRSKTPSFALEPADHQEFCLIRFHGGPPYEDIAFKIVNKEWEYGQKRGFKCVFERGILQVEVVDPQQDAGTNGPEANFFPFHLGVFQFQTY